MSFDPTRPFRRADALAAGVSPMALRGPDYRRVFRGIYVSAQVASTPVERAEAALLLFGPEAFASHSSAARIFGVPIPALPDEHVSVPTAAARRDRDGIVAHVAGRASTTSCRGLRVSTPARMWVELATLVGLVDLVVAGDHVLRHRLATATTLAGEVELARSRPAQAALRLVRERVDSPMETRVRLLLTLAGLPEPAVNLEIRNPVDGMLLRRHDLAYEASRLAIEYDGRHHIRREQQWERDLARREESESDGWRVIVLTAADIYRDPGGTVERVWRALVDRGQPGVPARPGDRWRPFFPGRPWSA